ncbi:hypothetical protein [Spirillospora sp. NBC_01491]|uniref:hypothetical protein n=1 Tax=Spirillospora sp. NBC_01491 TaxID=2976007 RepID=UPI002E347928|nr:hypothetical protein [Spirillospora sp. NBC_01491]
MTVPLNDAAALLWTAGPYLVSGGIVLLICVALMVLIARRTAASAEDDKKDTPSLENRLTFLVAVIIAGVCAQGMGKFFYDKLDFPIELVIVVGGVLELTAFVCALRARRNILDPKVGKAGVDGVAVWVITALSGVFSALDADKGEVALFRLVMPLVAAWLWERGMAIERRRIRGRSFNIRLTPERVLVWLRIAEATGRTAAEVDAQRRLTRVATAADRVRSLREADAKTEKITRAKYRLRRATRAAVEHANLARDPERQAALLAQIGSLSNAEALADLTTPAPWAGLAEPEKRTWFEAQGLDFAPPVLHPQIRATVRGELLPAGSDGGQVSDGSETCGPDRADLDRPAGAETHGSRTQVPDPDGDGSEPHGSDRSDEKVSDPADLPHPRTRKTQIGPKTQTGPKKRTGSKAKPLQRINEAIAADKAYLADHGRHIPAEKLAKALSIGKPAALELVKQIRGGHIDLAKAADQ